MNKMSDENYISLKEFFLHKLEEQERSLTLARQSLEKRLEGMNEFRAQLQKQEGTFVTRKELDIILNTINKDRRADISILISLLAIIVAVLTVFFKL